MEPTNSKPKSLKDYASIINAYQNRTILNKVSLVADCVLLSCLIDKDKQRIDPVALRQALCQFHTETKLDTFQFEDPFFAIYETKNGDMYVGSKYIITEKNFLSFKSFLHMNKVNFFGKETILYVNKADINPYRKGCRTIGVKITGALPPEHSERTTIAESFGTPELISNFDTEMIINYSSLNNEALICLANSHETSKRNSFSLLKSFHSTVFPLTEHNFSLSLIFDSVCSSCKLHGHTKRDCNEELLGFSQFLGIHNKPPPPKNKPKQQKAKNITIKRRPQAEKENSTLAPKEEPKDKEELPNESQVPNNNELEPHATDSDCSNPSPPRTIPSINDPKGTPTKNQPKHNSPTKSAKPTTPIPASPKTPTKKPKVHPSSSPQQTNQTKSPTKTSAQTVPNTPLNKINPSSPTILVKALDFNTNTKKNKKLPSEEDIFKLLKEIPLNLEQKSCLGVCHSKSKLGDRCSNTHFHQDTQITCAMHQFQKNQIIKHYFTAENINTLFSNFHISTNLQVEYKQLLSESLVGL